MNLKQLIGASAFYMINKTIMKKVGIEAALLLQHLVDLEDSYFKGIEFYQQVDRIKNDTDLSEHKIREAKKMLIKHGAISIKKKGLPSKDHFVINHNDIQLWFKDETTTGSIIEPLEIQKIDHKDKESNIQKNNNTNIKLDKNIERVYDVFLKKYPKNRINAKAPVISYLKKLNEEDIKLTISNLDRYLTIANGFVKNLRNYLEQECWSEAWLSAEELNKNKKQDTKYKSDGKTINTQYIDKF